MVSISAITVVILHIAIIITFLVIAAISRIFGAARKKRPLYKLFYVASGFIALSIVVNLLQLDWNYMAYVAAALDLIGLTIGCAITYFYWDWLPREMAKG